MSKKVFLCGIAGSGMSALARYFLAEGYTVHGSDAVENATIRALEEEGVQIESHTSVQDITKNINLFIYTEAIPLDHPQIVVAKKCGIDTKKYFEALGEISKKYYTIAVAGTHGKSSTTAMIATALKDAGKEVTAIVGANIHDWNGKNFLQANKGASDGMPTKNYLVVEACEYRESFLQLEPNGIVVTNVEPDHLDYFGTKEKYFEAFRKFLKKLPQFGFFTSYLTGGENILNILPENFHPRKFDAGEYTNFIPTLKAQGNFQRLNAATTMATCEAISIQKDEVIPSLEKFSGLSRRFDIRGEKNKVLIIDDYAHHPTAIKMVIESAREYMKRNKRKKLWVVFQPHQFSRTQSFYNEFVSVFNEADEVLIPNIYECRDSEQSKESVSAHQFAQDIEETMTKSEKKNSNIWGRGNRKRGEVFYKKQARHTFSMEQTIEHLNDYAYEGDVVVVMGAGDVYKISDIFLEGAE